MQQKPNNNHQKPNKEPIEFHTNITYITRKVLETSSADNLSNGTEKRV
jgi:hypothetical protein